MKREEYEQLEAQSIPLRNYLMKHVLPTLTEGLNDCCKTRPDDPVDYLVNISGESRIYRRGGGGMVGVDLVMTFFSIDRLKIKFCPD